MTFCRRRLRYLSYFLTVLTLFLCGCSTLASKSVSKSALLLGTAVKITLYDSSDESIIDSCFELCREYEALFSRNIEDSEISLLNERKISTVSDDTAALLTLQSSLSALFGALAQMSRSFPTRLRSPRLPRW